MEISEIKKYAHSFDVPIMKDDGIEFLCSIVKNLKDVKEKNDVRVLEIGSGIGYSAIMMASVSENVKITTIEIDINRFSLAKQNIEKAKLSDRITVICADALTENIEVEFDLIFIDAAKAQYKNFFQKFSKNLSADGVIVSDNLSFHGMVSDITLTHNYSTKKLVRKIKKYVSFLKSNPLFKTDFFEVGDGISVSRKNKNYIPLKFMKVPYSEEKFGDYLAEVYEGEKNPADFVKGEKFYFAILEHKFIGFVSFTKDDETLFIKNFFVKSESRKNNFSRQIIFYLSNLEDNLKVHKFIIDKKNLSETQIAILEKIGFFDSENKSALEFML